MNRRIVGPIVAVAFLTVGAIGLRSCGANRAEANYEGVLMRNYGRNGLEDFNQVTGAQGLLWWGEEFYQVPMWEQRADPQSVAILAKDQGSFTVDPTYTYNALRGKGRNIIFNYKQVGMKSEAAMDNLEANILNPMVVNAYREEARNYSTDSLMNNLTAFEKAVEARLGAQFEAKFFHLGELTSGLKPPQSMSDAIEARNNAVQKAIQVKNELKTAEMYLEKAKIDAEANRVRTSGLSNANLQEQYIEMLRTTDNKVIITDGKTPVILTQ